MPRVVLAGGGTGGHLFPMAGTAAALAESGLALEQMVFVGSRRGQDRAILGAGPVRLIALPGRGLRRSLGPRALLQNLRALAGLAGATLACLGLFARWRPAVVVSFGGYAALPAGLAAIVWRRPLVVVDLDAMPGVTQRILGRVAAARCVALEARRAGDEVTGVPLRAELAGLARDEPARRRARHEMSPPIEDARAVIVVMTGSLGARSVNDAVSDLAASWRARGDVTLVHVAGRRDFARVTARAPSLEGLDYRVVEFADMTQLWAIADVALCRAGAATLAELAALGIASVLVPLPGMAAHQAQNAERFARAGAALVLEDASLSVARLGAALETLLDRAPREAMGAAARSLARPDAAARIAQVIRRTGSLG